MMPIQRWECYRCRSLRFLDYDQSENPILEYICIVKRLYKLLGVLLLASIYCCGIGVAGGSLHSPDTGHLGKGNYFSAAKAAMFCHIPQTESSFDKVNDLPAPGPNVFFGGILGEQRPHDLLLGAIGRQYLNFSVNFLVRHRKADLIFPFHYFW